MQRMRLDQRLQPALWCWLLAARCTHCAGLLHGQRQRDVLGVNRGLQ